MAGHEIIVSQTDRGYPFIDTAKFGQDYVSDGVSAAITAKLAPVCRDCQLCSGVIRIGRYGFFMKEKSVEQGGSPKESNLQIITENGCQAKGKKLTIG